MTDTILGELARNGILGVVSVCLIVALRSLYRDYREEQKARISDAQRFNDALLQAHANNHETAREMGAIYHELVSLREEAQRKKQIRELAEEAAADCQREEERHRERIPTGKHRPYGNRDGE